MSYVDYSAPAAAQFINKPDQQNGKSYEQYNEKDLKAAAQGNHNRPLGDVVGDRRVKQRDPNQGVRDSFSPFGRPGNFWEMRCFRRHRFLNSPRVCPFLRFSDWRFDLGCYSVLPTEATYLLILSRTGKAPLVDKAGGLRFKAKVMRISEFVLRRYTPVLLKLSQLARLRQTQGWFQSPRFFRLKSNYRLLTISSRLQCFE